MLYSSLSMAKTSMIFAERVAAAVLKDLLDGQ
jgi:hypothetical protein